MFKLRILPSDETIANLVARYPDMNSLALKAGLQLLRLGHDMSEALDELLESFGLNQGTFFCLIVMNRTPETPCSANQLAEALGVSSATMTSLLSALETLGYIQRDIDQTDRRRLCVSLSPSGRAFIDRVMPECYTPMNKFMGTLNTGELSNLLSSLDRLSVVTDTLRGPAA